MSNRERLTSSDYTRIASAMLAEVGLTFDDCYELGRPWLRGGWQSALATYLKIDRTQIWRYVTSNRVPGPVEAAVTCWIKNQPPS